MTALTIPSRRPRIVVLLANPENRRLLSETLADRYDVGTHFDDEVVADTDGGAVRDQGPFDLCIVDGISVGKHRRVLARLRRSYEPAYLPVLLLADRRAPDLRSGGIWEVVDDVLFRPVERLELVARVQSLLRTRELSLRAARLSDLYEHERLIAQRLQDGAVPRDLPLLGGLRLDAVYRPADDAARVGGDWYDVLRLPDGRVVLTIGDVSGSGIDAAVTMSQMRQVLRAVANVHSDPALMLDAAERTLLADEVYRQLSCFVGVVDLVTEEITYSSAGHPPPLLRDPQGNVETLAAGGLLLGTSIRLPRSSTTIAFPAGSMLVLYTDGVTEAERDPVAGEAKLLAATRALSFADPAPASLLAEAMRAPQASDDVALVTICQQADKPGSRLKRVTFDAGDADSGRAAQRSFRERLRRHQMPENAITFAETIFAELLGNVVRHARGIVEVALDLQAINPVLNVLDRGAGFQHFPRLPHDLLSERGRGLFIVSQLAEEFSVQLRTHGGSHARVVLRMTA